MLNCVYRLVAPRIFEPVELEVPLSGDDLVIVRPTHLSICNADIRYYLGRRDPEVLARKLPMALIHEGIGRVINDFSGQLKSGTRVVMLPNNPHETDAYIAENYLRSSEFCGSGFDGFMQEFVALPRSRVLEIPQGIDCNIAAFTELVSVAVHAVRRFERFSHGRRDVVGVWGDGNVGFIVSLVLRTLHPDMHIFVVGHNESKLSDFTFVNKTLLSDESDAIPLFDHAFECCGGVGSAHAIDQIIDYIMPEGTISLMGVSENAIPMNTRMVLEKGLHLFGSSRSGREDFVETVALFENHPEILGYLSALVGAMLKVSSVSDITQAFEADLRKSMGKTIMKWHI